MNEKIYFVYSKRVKIITTISAVVLVLLFFALGSSLADMFKGVLRQYGVFQMILLFVVLSAVVVMFYFIANAPIYYRIDESGLYLKKTLGYKYFSLDDYTIDEDLSVDVGKGVRVFGSGGFFGYTGKFYLNKFGMCDFYITNESQDVISIVKKNSGKYTFISK